MAPLIMLEDMVDSSSGVVLTLKLEAALAAEIMQGKRHWWCGGLWEAAYCGRSLAGLPREESRSVSTLGVQLVPGSQRPIQKHAPTMRR